MELVIQQVALKYTINQVQMTIKYVDKMHAVKMQLANNQRIIKYNNPLSLNFGTDRQSNYIHFFIQTEENGYNKVLGNKRITINEWTDPRKERVVDIDLEGNNNIAVNLKCIMHKQEEKNMRVMEQQPQLKRTSQIDNAQKDWSRSLRMSADNQTTQKKSPNGRKSPSVGRKSPQGQRKSPKESKKSPNTFQAKKKMNSYDFNNKPTALEICKQQLQNSKLSESEEDEYDQSQVEQMISPRTQTPVPIMQYTPENSGQRVKTDTTNDKFKKQKQTPSQSQTNSIDELSGEITSSIVVQSIKICKNRISQLENLIQQKFSSQDTLIYQQQQQRLLNFNNYLNSEIIEDQLHQYKQMIKELALLLDVNPDGTSIVMAVSRLVQKCRTQNETIIKLQCDNQMLQQHLQNLTIQQTIQQTKQEDFQKSIKQKLNIYENLFEENVKLKNVLKQDMSKIVELSMELKKLKQDSIEQMEIEKQINQLNKDIELVGQEIDEKRKNGLILTEELNQIQQLADESITSDRSN